ncbi:hypothetical protein [Pseudorhodoferax sp. LjRoot39]|uniref:hypothetical protein n=1 Tax=Pseudorhodoferax sp. LjRoot39 TaxID=3342328 RepID=UPI003F505F4C
MMDNLAYIALDGLQADIRRDLEAGVLPIGHLLSRLWVRRHFLSLETALLERLWSAAGGLPAHSTDRGHPFQTMAGSIPR